MNITRVPVPVIATFFTATLSDPELDRRLARIEHWGAVLPARIAPDSQVSSGSAVSLCHALQPDPRLHSVVRTIPLIQIKLAATRADGIARGALRRLPDGRHPAAVRPFGSLSRCRRLRVSLPPSWWRAHRVRRGDNHVDNLAQKARTLLTKDARPAFCKDHA
jgi:hypothetical protein